MIESETEYTETVKRLREAIADLDNSDNWLTHEEVFERIRKRFNIPRDGDESVKDSK